MASQFVRLSLVLAVCAWPAMAGADTIAINSGTAVLDALAGPGPTVFASLNDDTLSLNFTWRDARAQCTSGAPRCNPGDVITMSTFLQSSFVSTPPVENQAMGGPFAFTGNLTFAGPLVVLPPVTSPGLGVDFSGPFTFGGTLSTYRVLGVFEPVLLSTNDLVGSGTVTGRYVGSSQLIRLQYDFAPVPDPGTLFLVGAGLAGVRAARRRRD